MAKLAYSANRHLSLRPAHVRGDGRLGDDDRPVTGDPRELSVGGPALAAEAIRAGLVDEVQLFLAPIVVGGGKPALPDGVRVPLALMEQRRFGNGVVFLRYGTRGAP
jgi:dihydrofolate reductase